MVTFKIRFEYQESHKLRDDFSYRVREFSVENEDEKRGFLKGLNIAVGTIYLGFEEIK